MTSIKEKNRIMEFSGPYVIKVEKAVKVRMKILSNFFILGQYDYQFNKSATSFQEILIEWHRGQKPL